MMHPMNWASTSASVDHALVLGLEEGAADEPERTPAVMMFTAWSPPST